MLESYIEELLEEARRLQFFPIAINTNAIRLDQHPHIPALADATVVSLHSAEPMRLGAIYGVGRDAAERAIGNILQAHEAATAHGNRLIANCVVTRASIDDADSVVTFCMRHRIPFSIVPAIVDFRPELAGRCGADTQPPHDYVALVDRVLELKKHHPNLVAASTAYLRQVRNLQPFDCRPSAIVSISPDGNVLSPCDAKFSDLPNILGTSVGDGRNVAQVLDSRLDYNEAFSSCTNNCMKACNVEPAMLAAYPLTTVYEQLRGMMF